MAVHGCTMDYFNFSRYPYPGRKSIPVTWDVVVKCAFIVLIILVAIVGNTLMIVIVMFSKKMRTTTNYYILNLVAADLFIACVPTWVYLVINVQPGWVLRAFLCKFNAFLLVCLMCTMSFTMIAIAGDRFFAIVFPLKSRVTQRRVAMVTAISWVLGIAIGTPLLVNYQYKERQWANYLERFCIEQWPMIVKSDGSCDGGKTSEKSYWTVVLVVLNWVPMLVMTFVYVVIIQRLHFGRVTHNGSVSMSAVQQRSAKRVVIMMFVLLITFVVCTVPFQVSTIYEVFKDPKIKLPDWFDNIYYCAQTLMYSHSAINPIVYGAMNQSFRNGFRHLVARMKFRNNSSCRSQYSTNETATKPNISIVNRNSPDAASLTGSLTQLIRCSSQLSFAALKGPPEKQ
ncbi:hypothetical protein BsWGS_06883 [Bradybaena similaris]